MGNVEQQNTHDITIVNINLDNLRKGSIRPRDLVSIRLGSFEDIVRAVIKKYSRDNLLSHLYSFEREGNYIICGFDLFERLENDRRCFYYAISNKRPAAFARYNYVEDIADFTENVGEHSYMYVKIISLAEPYPFFKQQKAKDSKTF